MNKLKKFITCIILLITIVIIILIVNPFKRYKKYIVEHQLMEAINNGIVGNNISKSFENEYKFAVSEDTNIYKIDEFIKYYFELLNTCILIKKGQAKKNNIKEFFVKGNHMNITVSRISGDSFAEFIVDNMTEDDVELYNNQKFDDFILNDLEKKFIHKSSNKYEDWYLSGNENKKIELLYNCYIWYTPNDKTNNNNFDKITELKIISPLNRIDKIDKENTLSSKIKYTTKNGITKELKRVVLLSAKNGRIYYSPVIYLQSLLYNQTINPHIRMSQHDYDREREEWSRQEEERARQQWEYDQNPVVAQEYIDIPPFVKNIQSAYLFINKYEDGSMSIECVLIKRIKKDGNIADDKRQYILPYDNVSTKEEALERYLSDKEHYDADEKWLKEGNIDYKGD